MPPSVPARGERIGRYVVYDEIASGGMATVHIGRAVGAAGFGRTVAVKRLHAHFAREPEFVSMLLDEARLAARIHHPNVVATLDVVTSDREMFLVMEYVPGESLARLVAAERQAGRLVPLPVTIAVLVGALRGLHAAHEAKSETGEPLGIVHRDVSPQNMLVGVDGVSRVLDFGVAKAAFRLQSTREGQVKGKLRYLAPEQIAKGTVDRRTDLFAASVVLWESLTGSRLFVGDDAGAMVESILREPIRAPSAVQPAIPRKLDDLVLRGLSRDIERRFATAAEMADALERTTPMASSREVGRWVESVAGAGLVERARLIAEMERCEAGVSGIHATETPGLEGVGRPRYTSRLDTAADSRQAPAAEPTNTDQQLAADTSGVEPRARRRPVRTLTVALGAAAAGALTTAIAVVLVLGAGRRAASPPPPDPPSSSEPIPALSAEPVPSETAAPVASSAARIEVRRPPLVRPPKLKPKPGCDPPFTIDSEGVRTYKANCI